MANYPPEHSDLHQPREVKIIDGRAVGFSDVVVHEFPMGDVEDPDLFAAQPLWEWQQSEAGKWVMENAVETPYWMRAIDQFNWGHNYKIMARLSDQNQTYYHYHEQLLMMQVQLLLRIY